MSTDPFAGPASSTGITWDELKGHLVLVDVKSQETDIVTAYGTTDAIRGDVIDLDTDDQYTDTLVFPKVLQGQLRPRIGGKVLGRVGQGEKKPGQSAPWKLEDPSEADKAKARAWIDRNKDAFAAPF